MTIQTEADYCAMFRATVDRIAEVRKARQLRDEIRDFDGYTDAYHCAALASAKIRDRYGWHVGLLDDAWHAQFDDGYVVQANPLQQQQAKPGLPKQDRRRTPAEVAAADRSLADALRIDEHIDAAERGVLGDGTPDDAHADPPIYIHHFPRRQLRDREGS